MTSHHSHANPHPLDAQPSAAPRRLARHANRTIGFWILELRERQKSQKLSLKKYSEWGNERIRSSSSSGHFIC